MTAWWWRSSPQRAMVGEPSRTCPPTLSPSPYSVSEAHKAALISHEAGFRHKWGSAHLVQSVTAEGFMGRWGAAQPWPIRDDIECLLSPWPVALGFDRDSVSETRPTQEERWLDRHKHKPLLLCLVHLGKAANIISSVSELCVPTYIRTTSLNGMHKKTYAMGGGGGVYRIIKFT